jgi:dihydrofolate reductase
MSRKVILYIAMSLDGYIAKHDGNLDFLAKVEMTDEDYGYSDLVNNIDTVIWGRKTFDKVLTFGNELPYKDKSVYVISKSKSGNHGHAVYRNDAVELLRELRNKEGKDIYCDGGGEVVFELLKHHLIDTIVISVIPHLLGDGVRLFKDGRPEQNLKFKHCVSYPSGLVQVWYDVKE